MMIYFWDQNNKKKLGATIRNIFVIKPMKNFWDQNVEIFLELK